MNSTDRICVVIGKTTFMRILGGFDTKYTGAVQYANPLRRSSRRQRVVGWCAQTDSLFDFLTVKEHLELYGRLLGSTRDSGDEVSNAVSRATITSTLAGLDLLDHAHKYAHSLSGGMKRRLSLAIACLGDPKVLLLDEPTSGCDGKNITIALLPRILILHCVFSVDSRACEEGYSR
jgi:ATP-binding cassette, subfamily A (ABC1), member 3